MKLCEVGYILLGVVLAQAAFYNIQHHLFYVKIHFVAHSAHFVTHQAGH